MKVSLFFLLNLAICIFIATGCESVSKPESKPTSVSSYKYGFIDKTGKQAISDRFSGAKSFSEGLAAVARGQGMQALRWGYIDKAGKSIIQPQFDDAFEFHDGLAIVKSDGVYGYINKVGQYVIQPQFTEARPFYGNIDAVAVSIGSSEEYGYRVQPKIPGDNPYNGTLAAVQIGTLGKDRDLKNKWGYIDREGNFKIKPKFCFAGTFYQDLALVKIPDSNGTCSTGRGGKWGYIDRNGKFAIEPIFEGGGNFHEGLTWAIPVNKQLSYDFYNKRGYIDKSGKFVIPPKFAQASDFSENLAAVGISKKNARGGTNIKWGFINRNGKFLVPLTYWSASRFYEGFSIVEVGEDYNSRQTAYLNKEGQIAFRLKSKGGSDSSGNFFEGIARVTVGLKCGYADVSGKFIFEPIFNECFDFYEGIARVIIQENSNKTGYIGKNGRYIVEPKFESSSGDFQEGLAVVRMSE
jgi:hypothetical protein